MTKTPEPTCLNRDMRYSILKDFRTLEDLVAKALVSGKNVDETRNFVSDEIQRLLLDMTRATLQSTRSETADVITEKLESFVAEVRTQIEKLPRLNTIGVIAAVIVETRELFVDFSQISLDSQGICNAIPEGFDIDAICEKLNQHTLLNGLLNDKLRSAFNNLRLVAIGEIYDWEKMRLILREATVILNATPFNISSSRDIAPRIGMQSTHYATLITRHRSIKKTDARERYLALAVTALFSLLLEKTKTIKDASA